MALEIDVQALAAARAAGGVVVDVREPDEYAAGHVPGALPIPLGELALRAGELPRHQRVHVICASGSRSLQAARWLASAGYDAVSVRGGTQLWADAGHSLEAGTARRRHGRP